MNISDQAPFEITYTVNVVPRECQERTGIHRGL